MTRFNPGAPASLQRRAMIAMALPLVLVAGACSRDAASRGVAPAPGGDGGAVASTLSDTRTLAGSTSDEGPEVRASPTAGSPDVVGTSLPPALGRERIVKTASIDIEVAKGGFAAAFSKVPTIAAANGGFVASSNSLHSGDGGRQSAGSLVVRVPGENFDKAREELIALGELQSQRLDGSDVGGQLTDLEARLRNLRSQEEAIRLLMTRTTSIAETIEVQRQLSTVREQIEQLAGEQSRLNDAVAFSTLTVSLAEPGSKPAPRHNHSPLADAFGRALYGAERVLAALIISLGYLIPFGILGGLGWLATRSALRRRNPVAP